MKTRILYSLILISAVTGCRSVRPPEQATAPHFHLMTYNVNWGAPRPELVVATIQREAPDIVCLQETTGEWERYLHAQLSKEYPYMSFRSSKLRAGGGLGFLSKAPAKHIAYIPSETGWFDAWIMAFPTPAGMVQVLNVHLQPPVSDRGSFSVSGYLWTGDEREREIKRFYAQRRDDLPLIVTGDFNDGEGSGVVRWLTGKGMRNALPEFDRSTPTWEWQTSALTFRRRMDHIMYPPDLYCYEARVSKTGASDHYPVIAVLGRRSDARAPRKP